MLVLIFHVGSDRYGLETSRIVEVIPRVMLRRLHHAPPYAAGTFNNRGAIVPVIDLCHLIQGQPSRDCLSTRIAIMNYPDDRGGPRFVGLMAERITETIDRSQTTVAAAEFHLETAPFLGDTIVDSHGLIQCIAVEPLLLTAQRLREGTTAALGEGSYGG